MTNDLVKRLRKVEPDAPGERTRWYRNPDGPKAADRIEALEAALREAQYRIQGITDVLDAVVVLTAGDQEKFCVRVANKISHAALEREKKE